MPDGNTGEHNHNTLYTCVCVYATVIIKEKEEQTNENRRIISNIAQIGFKAVHSMSTEFSQHRKHAYHSFH